MMETIMSLQTKCKQLEDNYTEKSLCSSFELFQAQSVIAQIRDILRGYTAAYSNPSVSSNFIDWMDVS